MKERITAASIGRKKVSWTAVLVLVIVLVLVLVVVLVLLLVLSRSPQSKRPGCGTLRLGLFCSISVF